MNGKHSISNKLTVYRMSLLIMLISTHFMTFLVVGAMSHLNIYQDNRDVPKSHKSSPQPSRENSFRQALLQQSGHEKLLHHRPSYSLLKGGEERVLIFCIA